MASVQHLTTALARIAVTVLVGLTLVALAPSVVAGWWSGVVVSGSMAPAVHVGDVVVTRPSGTPKPGHVVAVRDPRDPSRVLVHRLYGFSRDGRLVTKGDANAGPDSTPVDRTALIGEAVVRVPWVGRPVVWARAGDLRALGLSLALLMLAGMLGARRIGPALPLDRRGSHARPPVPSGIGRHARAPALIVLLIVLTHAHAPGLAWSAFTTTTANPGNSFAATNPFPTYPQAVLADNPVGYYRLDDAAGSTSAADSSPSNATGTYVRPGTTFRAAGGPAGGSSTNDTAVTFVGNGGVASSTASMTGPDTFTAEVWFKTGSTSQARMLGFGNAASGNSSTSDRFVRLTATGALQMVAGSTTLASSGSGFNDNQWHLASFSLGAAGMKLYVDGSPAVAPNTSVTSGTAYTGYWRVGGDNSYFSGTLDEAAVYLTQLSDAQVAAHYSAGTSATTLASYTAAVGADNPWALWHLDDPPLTVYENSGVFPTPMADSSGNGHNGQYFNVPPKGMTAGGAGAVGTSVRFLGAGMAYDPTSYTDPGTFSLELWFRDSTSTGGVMIEFSNVMSGSAGFYDRLVYLRDDGRVSFGAGGTITSAAAYNDGAWHHLVASYGSSLSALYIDAALVASAANPSAPQSYSGYWRWGGGSVTGWPTRPSSEFLDGDLDEVAIYPSALTSQQVAWHYHANH